MIFHKNKSVYWSVIAYKIIKFPMSVFIQKMIFIAADCIIIW